MKNHLDSSCSKERLSNKSLNLGPNLVSHFWSLFYQSDFLSKTAKKGKRKFPYFYFPTSKPWILQRITYRDYLDKINPTESWIYNAVASWERHSKAAEGQNSSVAVPHMEFGCHITGAEKVLCPFLRGEPVLTGTQMPKDFIWAACTIPREVPSLHQEVHPLWQPCHFGAACLFTPDHTCWHVCQNRASDQEKKETPSSYINEAAKSTCCIAAGAQEIFHKSCTCIKDKNMWCTCWHTHT